MTRDEAKAEARRQALEFGHGFLYDTPTGWFTGGSKPSLRHPDHQECFEVKVDCREYRV